MSDIQRRPDAAPARRPGKKPNPLKQLPEEFRKPVAFFWACNEHLLKSPLALATRLAVWVEKERLTLDELRPVLNRLVSPERCARFEHAGQLLAALAAEVAAALDARPGSPRSEFLARVNAAMAAKRRGPTPLQEDSRHDAANTDERPAA